MEQLSKRSWPLLLLLPAAACILLIVLTYQPINDYVRIADNVREGDISYEFTEEKDGTFHISLTKGRGKEKDVGSGTTGEILSNGIKLYYAAFIEEKGGTADIFRMNIRSGRKEKIIEDLENPVLLGTLGRYLYIGLKSEKGDCLSLNVLDMESGSFERVMDNCDYRISVSETKILVEARKRIGKECPLYTLNPDGSGRKKIRKKVWAAVINGSTVYYERYTTPGAEVPHKRVYTCNLSGGDAKPHTEWYAGEIPQKYRFIETGNYGRETTLIV